MVIEFDKAKRALSEKEPIAGAIFLGGVGSSPFICSLKVLRLQRISNKMIFLLGVL